MNIDGYYDDLIKMLDKSIEENFLHAKYWFVVNDINELMKHLIDTDLKI